MRDIYENEKVSRVCPCGSPEPVKRHVGDSEDAGASRRRRERNESRGYGLPSDAWQEIVYTDVTFDSGRADSEITWEDYKKTIFCGGEFEARIRNHGSSELDLRLKVASPAGTVKTSPCGSERKPGMHSQNRGGKVLSDSRCL